MKRDDGIDHRCFCQYDASGLDLCPKCLAGRRIPDSSDALASAVEVGDQILMPDFEIWCTVENIQPESGTGRLFMSHVEKGFSRLEVGELVTVRRATPVQRLRVENRRLKKERDALIGWLEKLEAKASGGGFSDGWTPAYAFRHVREAVADDRVHLELEVGDMSPPDLRASGDT